MRTARAIACLLAWCLALQAAKVGATPSTVIWIPSADIQKFAIPHVNFDAYVPFRSEPDGTRKPPAVFLGPTIGVLPFEKLWLAVDYQGGNSLLGALNAGAAWRFAPNVGVVLGYDHFYGGAVAGRDTFTVQVDLDVQ